MAQIKKINFDATKRKNIHCVYVEKRNFSLMFCNARVSFDVRFRFRMLRFDVSLTEPNYQLSFLQVSL